MYLQLCFWRPMQQSSVLSVKMWYTSIMPYPNYKKRVYLLPLCLKFNIEMQLLSRLCVFLLWDTQNLIFRNNTFKVAFCYLWQRHTNNLLGIAYCMSDKSFNAAAKWLLKLIEKRSENFPSVCPEKWISNWLTPRLGSDCFLFFHMLLPVTVDFWVKKKKVLHYFVLCMFKARGGETSSSSRLLWTVLKLSLQILPSQPLFICCGWKSNP